jgi:hypothetical protein
MIKYSSIGLKKPFFQQLAEFMETSTAPTIPVLRLFQRIVKDHKERERLSSKSATSNGMNYGNVPKWVTTSTHEPVEVRKVFDEIE